MYVCTSGDVLNNNNKKKYYPYFMKTLIKKTDLEYIIA